MSINDHSKTIIGIGCAALILGVVIFYDGNQLVDEKQSVEQNIVNNQNNEKDAVKPNLVSQVTHENSSNEEYITELRNKAAEMYRATFKQGDVTKVRQYSYEDEWCVASEDLKEGDFYYFQDEIKSWLLSRGHVFLQNQNERQSFSLNNEFVESYQELDIETLIQYSKNDDQMALVTLVNRPDVDSDTKFKAARRLVMLGNTSTGLERLVMNELNQSGYQKEDTEKSKSHLINALAYVEYGLMRYDTSALATFLMYASDKDTFLNGLDPAELINSSDYENITKKAHNLVDKINEGRISNVLPELDMDTVPKAARMYYQDMLAKAYGRYDNLMNENWVPTNWRQEYLAKNPCVSRMISRNKFLNEQLPEITKENSRLQGK